MRRGVTLIELLAASALLSVVVVGAVPTLIDARRMLAESPSISTSQLGLFADLALAHNGPLHDLEYAGFIATTAPWSAVDWPDDLPALRTPAEAVTVTMFRPTDAPEPGTTATGWLEFRCEDARVYRVVTWSIPAENDGENGEESP